MRKTNTVKDRRQSKPKTNRRVQEARKMDDLAPGGVLLFPFSGLVLAPLLAGVDRDRPTARRTK